MQHPGMLPLQAHGIRCRKGLGFRSLGLAQDEPAVRAHKRFLQAMADMDRNIERRNADKTNKMRSDRAIPYEVLVPHAPSGITSSGVSQSVSY